MRCAESHNPGVWPYTSRCVHVEHDPAINHRDRFGNEWSTQELDPSQSHEGIDTD